MIRKYDDERRFLSHLVTLRYKERNIDEIIFPEIRKQAKPNSLQTFRKIAYQCLSMDRKQRPTMAVVIKQLQISLEFQIGQQRFSQAERDHREKNNLMHRTSKVFFSVMKNLFLFSNRVNSDRSNDRGNSYLEDSPGIKEFQIIGDAKPGGKLLVCGFPLHGTSQCMFQWVHYHRDVTLEYIEGATSPEYIVTADDVDKLIAVECIPMDDHGRQGEIVRLFANEQNKIICDPEMQEEIDKYMAAGQASFSILLLMDSSENREQTTFTLRRSNYQVKINRTQEIFIQGEYTNDVSIKIPSGLPTQFVLTYSDGSSHPFNTFQDARMRDTLVLTMRMFQRKVLDERRNAT
ncbi:unnamed protein product [Lactuca saligna]|uniref:Protein kinase domain-containing protein n=1 Tax=Lactuca saligna TaxID=75948 RepID=A0AA35VML1_LACSI|nr:unnamed protein product [Lactuca saligna]